MLLGYENCPVSIEIAREKTYTDGKSYPVEIIGQRAFLNCALYNNYPTKTIFVTKQVKLIKQYGFSYEHYLAIISQSKVEVNSNKKNIGTH